MPEDEEELEWEDWRPVVVCAVALDDAAADVAPVAEEADAARAEPLRDAASAPASELAYVPRARVAESEVATPLTDVEFDVDEESAASRPRAVEPDREVLEPTPVWGVGRLARRDGG